MGKRVIVLGASRYYIRGIEALRRAGFYVIAVDRNASAPGLQVADEGVICDIRDQSAVLRLAREFRVDGIVPVNDYGVLTAAYVSSSLGLPGVSTVVASRAVYKAEMRRRWAMHGLPCPAFELAEGPVEVARAAERIGYPCILKPAYGEGGASRGVKAVHSPEELEEALAFSLSFYDDPRVLVEELVDADIEHSVEVLIFRGEGRVITVADKVKSPLPYRVDKAVIYPSALDGERLARVEATSVAAALSLGIENGAAHVELATVGEGVVLFELGARCGGGGTPEPIVPYATGIEEFVELARILVGETPSRISPVHRRGCVYWFLTPRPGIVSAVEGIDELRRSDGILDFEVLVGPGDVVRAIKTGLDRAGFIIAGGADREEALRRAQTAENLIRFHYR